MAVPVAAPVAAPVASSAAAQVAAPDDRWIGSHKLHIQPSPCGSVFLGGSKHRGWYAPEQTLQVARGPFAAPHATQRAAAQGCLERVSTGTFGGALCPCRGRLELVLAGREAWPPLLVGGMGFTLQLLTTTREDVVRDLVSAWVSATALGFMFETPSPFECSLMLRFDPTYIAKEAAAHQNLLQMALSCLLYTSPSPRD